jgi:hypothetical protein
MNEINEDMLKHVFINGVFSMSGFDNSIVTDKKKRKDLENHLKKQSNFLLKQIGFECKVSIKEVRESLETKELTMD